MKMKLMISLMIFIFILSFVTQSAENITSESKSNRQMTSLLNMNSTQGSAFQQLHRDIIINADVYATRPQILAAGYGFEGIISVPGLLNERQIQLAYSAGAGVVRENLGRDPAAPLRNITSAASPIGLVLTGFTDELPTQTFMDAMPIEFSHPIRPSTLSPDDFRIVLNTRELVTPLYAALNPNYDYNERQTVVLFGYFGNRQRTGTPGAVYPVEVHVVASATPLEVITAFGPVSAVGFRQTSSNPYDLNNGPKLIAAKLTRLSLAGDYPPAAFADSLGNHGVEYYGDGADLYRLRLFTSGGFSPDGVSGFLPDEFSRYFRLHATGTSGDRPIFIRQAGTRYRVKGGTLEVLGIAELGPGLPDAANYTYVEDHDNQFDLIIRASSAQAAQSLLAVEIRQSVRKGYSPIYNPGGPGTDPLPGVTYTQPAPAQVVPIQIALRHPNTVSYAAQTLEAYDLATDLAVAFRLINPATGEMRLTSSSLEAHQWVHTGFWQLLDVPFATNPSDSLMVTVEALHHASRHDTVYTSDTDKIAQLVVQGYQPEGAVFTAYDRPFYGLDPIYELVSQTGQHYYVGSLSEMQQRLNEGWTRTGIAFYTVRFLK